MDSNKDIEGLNPTPVDEEIDQELEAQEEQRIEISFNVHTRRDERFVAFNLLYSIDRSDYDVSLEKTLERFKLGFNLSLKEDSYARDLVSGACEDREKLDELMIPLLENWKIERLGCATKLILRMALWELLQEKIMPSVIINEAIELAKLFAEKDAYKFVNGLLDRYCKKHGVVIERLEKKHEKKDES